MPSPACTGELKALRASSPALVATEHADLVMFLLCVVGVLQSASTVRERKQDQEGA